MGMLIASDGSLITENYSLPANFFAWWDGDLGREVLDGINISKYDPYTYKVKNIFTASECHSNNAAKSNPSLAADILGDWREEAIYPTLDNTELRIYTTTTPTAYRIPCLMTDGQYRNAVASQNVGYNQPTHVGYDLGYDTESIPVPQIYTVDENGNELRNPDLGKGSWDIDDLYVGETAELAVGEPKALINGVPYYIDGEDNTNAPYVVNDRTMVPIRFISEAFGANVAWDEETGTVTVKDLGTTITMTVNSSVYTVNGEERTMDAAPEIVKERVFVPLRATAEAIGKNVGWNENGVISVSDREISVEPAAVLEAIKTSNALQPQSGAAVFENGEKMAPTGSVALEVYASEGDAEAACDLNYDTVWSSDGDGIIMMTTDKWPISAVMVKFADGKQHSFRIYSCGAMTDEDREDITNIDGWDMVREAVSDGSDEAETFIFPVPKYHNTIKLELLDGEPCEIAEICAIGVQ